MHNFSEQEASVIRESVKTLAKALAPLAESHPSLRSDSHDSAAIKDRHNYQPILEKLQEIMPTIADSYFGLNEDEVRLIKDLYDPNNFIDASNKLLPILTKHAQKYGLEGLTRVKGILSILIEVVSQSGTTLVQIFKNPNPEQSSDLVSSGIIASLHAAIQFTLYKVMAASSKS